MKRLLVYALAFTTLGLAALSDRKSDHKVAKLCFEIQKRVNFIRDSAQIISPSEADIFTLYTVNRQLQKLQYKIHQQLSKIKG